LGVREIDSMAYPIERKVVMTQEVADVLKSYVYVYIDPRDSLPFYIGKGVGNRLFAHLDDSSETDKTAKIAEIRKAGLEPIIHILRYGLSDSEATLVEASAIDLIGKSQLTNKVLGHHSKSYGRIDSNEIITMLTAQKVEVTHKSILITINKLYRSDMTPEELYEATRGIWKMGSRREGAEFAMAVYQGIVREVYQIEDWLPAGSLEYKTRDSSSFKISGRWEFKGSIAENEIRSLYVGSSVGLGGQNPIRYQNT
jgi:hypothetical protein